MKYIDHHHLLHDINVFSIFIFFCLKLNYIFATLITFFQRLIHIEMCFYIAQYCKFGIVKSIFYYYYYYYYY